MSAIALREHAHVSKPLPLPEIRSRDDGRRYVSVFEGKPVRRPIVRVIVGQAPGAEERTAFARFPAAGRADLDLEERTLIVIGAKNAIRTGWAAEGRASILTTTSPSHSGTPPGPSPPSGTVMPPAIPRYRGPGAACAPP
jgi:hypothetical protein